MSLEHTLQTENDDNSSDRIEVPGREVTWCAMCVTILHMYGVENVHYQPTQRNMSHFSAQKAISRFNKEPFSLIVKMKVDTGQRSRIIDHNRYLA